MGSEIALYVPLVAPPPVPELVPYVAPVAVPEAVPELDLIGMVLTGLSPKSAAGYRKDLEAFRQFTGAKSALQAVLSFIALDQGKANAAALAWLDAMTRAALAPATIARRLAALKRCATRSRMVGLTLINLEVDRPKAEAFRDTRGPGPAGWRKMLELVEAEALGGSPVAVRNLAIVLLLHDRALRRGEVAGLDVPDDLELDRPAIWILGKGRKAKEVITINDRTRVAIEAWLGIRGSEPGPLFTRFDPARPEARLERLGEESVNRMVKALADRAGLGRVIRAHGLRHAGITQALDAGWDVRDVKAFSRHGRIDTVMIYDDRRKDVAGEITRSIGGGKRKRRSDGK